MNNSLFACDKLNSSSSSSSSLLLLFLRITKHENRKQSDNFHTYVHGVIFEHHHHYNNNKLY
ncbi:hypothetical protein DERP_005342 [Dermatophagoides pteronyssinus]|uniref:Uncharacterized protein n=1 Tax=Dermatophagoides pteronyssinus TaxID=6956 RepID=A0ABQ8JN89_DERPT|nr:hypothetical protein DERP_005342 [Dermatophagoides pteronyssinus]